MNRQVVATHRFADKLAVAYSESMKPDVEARLYVDTVSEIKIAFETLLAVLEMLGQVDRKSVSISSGMIELKNGSAIKISIKPELLSRRP